MKYVSKKYVFMIILLTALTNNAVAVIQPKTAAATPKVTEDLQKVKTNMLQQITAAQTTAQAATTEDTLKSITKQLDDATKLALTKKLNNDADIKNALVQAKKEVSDTLKEIKDAQTAAAKTDILQKITTAKTAAQTAKTENALKSITKQLDDVTKLASTKKLNNDADIKDALTQAKKLASDTLKAIKDALKPLTKAQIAQKQAEAAKAIADAQAQQAAQAKAAQDAKAQADANAKAVALKEAEAAKALAEAQAQQVAQAKAAALQQDEAAKALADAQAKQAANAKAAQDAQEKATQDAKAAALQQEATTKALADAQAKKAADDAKTAQDAKAAADKAAALQQEAIAKALADAQVATTPTPATAPQQISQEQITINTFNFPAITATIQQDIKNQTLQDATITSVIRALSEAQGQNIASTALGFKAMTDLYYQFLQAVIADMEWNTPPLWLTLSGWFQGMLEYFKQYGTLPAIMTDASQEKFANFTKQAQEVFLATIKQSIANFLLNPAIIAFEEIIEKIDRLSYEDFITLDAHIASLVAPTYKLGILDSYQRIFNKYPDAPLIQKALIAAANQQQEDYEKARTKMAQYDALQKDIMELSSLLQNYWYTSNNSPQAKQAAQEKLSSIITTAQGWDHDFLNLPGTDSSLANLVQWAYSIDVYDLYRSFLNSIGTPKIIEQIQITDKLKQDAQDKAQAISLAATQAAEDNAKADALAAAQLADEKAKADALATTEQLQANPAQTALAKAQNALSIARAQLGWAQTQSDLARALTFAQDALKQAQDAQIVATSLPPLTANLDATIKAATASTLNEAQGVINDIQNQTQKMQVDQAAYQIARAAQTAQAVQQAKADAQAALTIAQDAQQTAQAALDKAALQADIEAALTQAKSALSKAQNANILAFKTTDDTLKALGQKLLFDTGQTMSKAESKLNGFTNVQNYIKVAQNSNVAAQAVINTATTHDIIQAAVTASQSSLSNAKNARDAAATQGDDTLKAAAQKAVDDATATLKTAQDLFNAVKAAQASLTQTQYAIQAAQTAVDSATSLDQIESALTQALTVLAGSQNTQLLAENQIDGTIKTAANDTRSNAQKIVTMAQDKKTTALQASKTAQAATQNTIVLAKTAQTDAQKAVDTAANPNDILAALKQAQAALKLAQDTYLAVNNSKDPALVEAAHQVYLDAFATSNMAQSKINAAAASQSQKDIAAAQIAAEEQAVLEFRTAALNQARIALTEAQQSVAQATTRTTIAAALSQAENAQLKAMNAQTAVANATDSTIKIDTQKIVDDATTTVKMAHDKTDAAQAAYQAVTDAQRAVAAANTQANTSVTSDQINAALAQAQTALAQATKAKTGTQTDDQARAQGIIDDANTLITKIQTQLTTLGMAQKAINDAQDAQTNAQKLVDTATTDAAVQAAITAAQKAQILAQKAQDLSATVSLNDLLRASANEIMQKVIATLRNAQAKPAELAMAIANDPKIAIAKAQDAQKTAQAMVEKASTQGEIAAALSQTSDAWQLAQRAQALAYSATDSTIKTAVQKVLDD
ncbi:MAG: hypothetical protein NTX86_00770, partial [Candidatus Dependentiae bacterium]|nr:hypothetical protein [Candidatus Dependentiae bacterium]